MAREDWVNKDSLLYFLNKLGIEAVREYDNKIISSCPYASVYHRKNTDEHPSFATFINDNSYSGFSCKACGAHGKVSRLVADLARIRKQDYKELIHEVELAEANALTFRYKWEELGNNTMEEPLTYLDEEVYKYVYRDFQEYPEAVHYVTEVRKISLEAGVLLNLRYDESQARVLFPVRTYEKHLVGFTGRAIYEDIKPKVRDYNGLPKKRIILGMDKWIKGNDVVIVEGLFAYARLMDLAIHKDYNVGAILGAEMTQEKADLLIDFGEAVHLMLDNDHAGDIGIFGREPNKVLGGAVGKLYRHIPIFIPEYPLWEDGSEKEDPDELTRQEAIDMLECSKLFVG